MKSCSMLKLPKNGLRNIEHPRVLYSQLLSWERSIRSTPKEQPPRKLSGKRTTVVTVSGERLLHGVRRRDSFLRQTDRWGIPDSLTSPSDGLRCAFMDVAIYFPSRLPRISGQFMLQYPESPRILPCRENPSALSAQTSDLSNSAKIASACPPFSLPLFLFPLPLVRCGTDPVSGHLRRANALPLLTFVSPEAIQS